MLLCLSTGAAHAGCATGLTTFLTCEVGAKRKALDVCYDDQIVTYSFGPVGAPELLLTETVANIDYTPWPGVGRAIWENVTFQNGDYGYTVFAGFERLFGEMSDADLPDPHFGGVVVRRAGTTIAELECTAGTVEAPWDDALFRAKEATGQTYDHSRRIWLYRE
ncbi:hypothetical protein [Cognatiyoonia sp. IB215182]|uniref:hypothetical protein n=1 Tax=Cognatiyoonia sp. IB215182 TaxID=3097353 RepID=UPI002A24E277|nr:hypothetical protein [Cognatiyoonia sp. IB215182]